MQHRYCILLVASLSLVAAGCSRGADRRSSGTPIAPSAQTATTASSASTAAASSPAWGAGGPLSRPSDVSFPPRNEPFDFRSQLETKYRDQLRRSATSTFVDNEGDVVWTQEYIRFRLNNCDHPTAVQKVFVEVDGGSTPATCGAALVESNAIAFPPRNEPFDFRRQLDGKYQNQLRRPPTSTFVDIEGAIVWLTEYLRYRLSTCDHASSVQKVFTQIDGGGIQSDCTPPPCIYTFSPSSQDVPASGGSVTVTINRPSGSCAWSASTNASFITPSATSGGAPTSVTFSVAPNTGSARSGTITFTWAEGSAQVVVNQAGVPPATVFASFQLFDFASQPGATTECQIRSLTSTQTTCTLNASSSFTSGRNVIVSYNWTVQYTYITEKTLTATSSSPVFSFSDLCGQVSSTAEGAVQPLSVKLIVTDDLGNTAIAISGTGNQPALQLRLFTCGI